MVGVKARWVPRPARQLKLQSATQRELHPKSLNSLLSPQMENRASRRLHAHVQLTSEPRVSTKSLSWGGGPTPPYLKKMYTSSPTTLRMVHLRRQIHHARMPRRTSCASLTEPQAPAEGALHAKESRYEEGADDTPFQHHSAVRQPAC